MLDVGWTELVVIAIVLIIVVGPKDLPPMLRTFGKMMSKMRGMATDFRHQFDEALREADLDDVRKTLSDAQKLNPAHSLREAMNPLRQMGNDIKADLQKATRPDDKPVTPASDLPPSPEIAASAVLPDQPSVPPSSPVEPHPVAPVMAVPLAGAVPVASPVAAPLVSKATEASPVAAQRKRTVKPKVGEDDNGASPRKTAVPAASDAVPVRKRKPAALAGDAAVADIGTKIRTRKPKSPAAGVTSDIPVAPKSGDDA